MVMTLCILIYAIVLTILSRPIHSFAVPKSHQWKSAIRTPTAPTDTSSVIQDLCESSPRPDTSSGETGLAFLFVSQQYAESFPDIVSTAYKILGNEYTLLSTVGGGVIGDGMESDNPAAPAMSILSGVIPASAEIEVFMFGPDEQPPPPSSLAWNAIGRRQDMPSYIVFADPFGPIQGVIDGLDSSGNSREVGSSVVGGGISCPVFGEDGPTVALNGKAYPRGTVLGVGLSGSLGLQVVVAQGCRPVGEVYRVTKGQDNFIEELNGKPAVEVLGEMAQGVNMSEEDKDNIQKYGIMIGLASPGERDVQTGDYLIRQILGFRVPGIMVGAEVKTGDVMRFHVRDPAAALKDMENMIDRTRTERLFSANSGKPLAAIQISCVARGRSLFGNSNVDINYIKGLLKEDDNPAAIAGFFANGEIGPTGVAGVGIVSKATHMHGFTTVACTINDFSAASTSLFDKVEANPRDDSAWG